MNKSEVPKKVLRRNRGQVALVERNMLLGWVLGNMNRRRLLRALVAGFLLVGTGFASAPFFLSLNPSQKADAELPRFDLSGIGEGRFKLLKHPKLAKFSGGAGWAILIYKKRNGEVRAWRLPIKGDLILLPDLHWWRTMYGCRDFGPTLVEGLVDETATIKCHDKEVPEWWADRWQWNLDGKNLSGQVADMESLIGVVEAGFFVLGKRAASDS